MRRQFCWMLAMFLAVLGSGLSRAEAAPLAHMVFFKLKESTPEHREQLVEGCRRFLAEHEGMIYFATGVLAEALERDVNVRDWDVSLIVVFRDRASHDVYQKHPRHLKFVEEYSPMWESVRVFDSTLAPRPSDQAADASRRIPLPDPAASFAGMIRGKVLAKAESV